MHTALWMNPQGITVSKQCPSQKVCAAYFRFFNDEIIEMGKIHGDPG